MNATDNQASSRHRAISTIVALLVIMLITFSAAFIGAITSMDGVRTWYPTLNKPSWNPPDWIFGPVWTTLYTLMGVACFLVWRAGPARPYRRAALMAYAVQLALNAAWSWIFFGLRQPAWALVEIIALLTAIVITIALFARIRPLAAWLLAPYLLWVGFATFLNFTLWRLNP